MGRYDDTDDSAVSTEDIDTPPSAPEREQVSPEVAATANRVIKRGWGAADSVIAADSPFAQRLKLSSVPVLIKFDEDDPYASYHQHWIERSGQKSFTCLASVDPSGCPLCDAGDRPSARFSFNVLLMEKGGGAVRRSFDVGPRVLDQLKNFHNNPTQGPLSKNYWACTLTGKKGSAATAIQLVKERDVEEDWPDYAPLTATQLSELSKTVYSNSIIQITPRKTLQAIAAEDIGAD